MMPLLFTLVEPKVKTIKTLFARKVCGDHNFTLFSPKHIVYIIIHLQVYQNKDTHVRQGQPQIVSFG